MKKNNGGFTLIELIVAMAMAIIVTAAATSVLLLGLRINRQGSDTASRQMTVRTLLSVMEDAAAEGNITEVKIAEDMTSWTLMEGERAVFSYDATDQTISTNGVVVLEGVYASNAIMEGQLLSLSIETSEGTYTSSVYCRTAEPVKDPNVGDLPGSAEGNVGKFIEILKSQYRSRGQIQGEYADAGKYFSEWYIGGYDKDPRWNADTPWCACYISWALAETYKIVNPTGTAPKYANVDDFMAYFQDAKQWYDTPAVGDLIFFDWDKGTDPEHVGVVLSVTNNMVYTIEGNSAGRVTVRSYSVKDPRIIGYGRIFE